MHRITLNIDLDANDLLEKEVTEAIKAETKRLTREKIDTIIADTIARVIDNRMAQWKRMDWVTESKVKRIVDDRVQESLKSFDFGIDKDKVEEMLETRLKAVGNLAKMKLSYMDKQIEEAVERAVRDYLNDYCFDKAVERLEDERNNADA